MTTAGSSKLTTAPAADAAAVTDAAQELTTTARGAGRDDAERKQANLPAQTLHLPHDVLAHSFAFLDASDVPAVAAACKGWSSALHAAESDGSMWLALIRKHHPIIERLTEMTIGNKDDNKGTGAAADDVRSESNDAGAHALVAQSSAPQSIPSPSLDWKIQFRRKKALMSRARASKEKPASNAAPDAPPRPLSSYVAHIDLVLNLRGRSEPVRIVSRVVDGLSYTDEGLVFPEIDFYDDISNLDFHDFSVSIDLVEKSTGRQTLLYCGLMDELDEAHVAYFDDFDDYYLHPIVQRLQSDCWRYDSYLRLERNGCICECSPSFFALPSKAAICSCGECQCSCCSCNDKWRCFYRYKMVLRLFNDPDWSNIMDESETLNFFQDALVYT